jgi:NAD(P)-dependent dehydrogenase (short-subunit alcohol dehydrogenase family)
MDRVVLITGSTRGIGFATAAEFLKNGDQIVILCRHERHVKGAIRDLSGVGARERIVGLIGDVRKEIDVSRIVSETVKRLGRIDVLINNAGVGLFKPLGRTTDQDWEDVLETNLKGVFLFLREVVPIMRKAGKGMIVNISSGLGVEGEAGFSAYCASKFGVIGLTQVVAAETSNDGIKTYAVLPGAVDTGLLKGLDLGLDASEVLRPEYVGRRIFEVAQGKRKSGQLVEVYS